MFADELNQLESQYGLPRGKEVYGQRLGRGMKVLRGDDEMPPARVHRGGAHRLRDLVTDGLANAVERRDA